MTAEPQLQNKPVLLSGIQPSGRLCLGNYIGAIKNWVDLQVRYDSIFLVVDLHALTIIQKPADLRQRCLSFLAQYIACGIDPEKSLIVIQSHVHQHAELAWVLSTMTYVGELNRMTQFKDKSTRHQENINAGLFTYPVLMAADILLYQANLVPVGADQKQHLELSREIAQRFNQRYSKTFAVPEPLIPSQGARIMSLQDPASKMSKSDENDGNLIALLDSPDTVRKKIKRAVTDSFTDIRFDEKIRPGLANLLVMFSEVTGEGVLQLTSRIEGRSYEWLKKELAEVIIEFLKPVQSEYQQIIDDKQYLSDILSKGAEAASCRARKTLSKVYRKLGLVPPAK